MVVRKLKMHVNSGVMLVACELAVPSSDEYRTVMETMWTSAAPRVGPFELKSKR
jgi:hypothetical protein